MLYCVFFSIISLFLLILFKLIKGKLKVDVFLDILLGIIVEGVLVINVRLFEFYVLGLLKLI